MVNLSFFAVSALVSLAAGQVATTQTPIATATGMPAMSPPEAGCGGCYLVADVAGIVFGGVATQTITQITQIGTGPNGTTPTTIISTASGTISTPVTTDQFSAGPGSLINPTFVSTRYDLLDSAITVNGATLTSPTQYELFTAYSITSFSQDANGVCNTVEGDRVEVSPASSYVVPSGVGGEFLTQAELMFINDLALSCAPGGGNVASTLQSMLTQETTASVSTGIIRPTPIPAMTTSMSTPTPTANTTISTGNPVAPTFTNITPPIMPGAGATIAPGIFGVGAALGLGLAALLLL